jgi:transcriptional regulator GlxA family with amidase domain
MIIGIPVYDGVDALDVVGPFEMFHWAGYDVRLVAEKPGAIATFTGPVFQVKASFAQAGAFDVLWTPGGNPDALADLMEDKRRVYLDFLIRQARTATWVASVCEGALLLAAAGLLDGYEATTHWAFIPCLRLRFPKVKIAKGHPRFVIDRNRITGGGISSGLDEALGLIELISGTKAAEGVQATTQYFPDPPVCGSMEVATECPVRPVVIPPPR